jgi:hypothetical protein
MIIAGIALAVGVVTTHYPELAYPALAMAAAANVLDRHLA